MPQIAIVALVILGYTLLAARLDRLSVSGPMILVTIGAVLGPSGVGAFAAPVTSESVQLLAELTLALLLFSDASSIGLKQAGSIAWVPARLLAIGLPLTIGAGALVGWLLFPALGLAFALLMGSILAPTDAALSLPVLVDRAIPVRVRRAINIESGLNDGIATPFVTLFLAVVVAEQASASQHWLIDAAAEIGLAIGVAILTGGFGGRVIARARQRGWASPASESLAVVSLAILAYASATTIGGNGFVAAFASGIFYRTATAAAEPSVEFADWIGVAGSYLVWLVFGIGFVGPVLAAGVDPAVLVYAVLSLTIVRMGPVALSMVRSPFRADTIALIGWFGPRGLASVVFLLVAFEQMGPAHPASLTLIHVVTWTVLVSIFLHGLSAGPIGALYGRRVAKARTGAWELGEADEPRLRHRPMAPAQAAADVPGRAS